MYVVQKLNIPCNPMSDELEQDEQNYTSKTSGDTEVRHKATAFRRSNSIDTMLESLDQKLSDNFWEEEIVRTSTLSRKENRGPIDPEDLSSQ